MDTSDLIKVLAADAKRPVVSLPGLWRKAAGVATALAAIAFAALLDPRPDIATAAQTPRFLMKFAISIALALSAFGIAQALLRPEGTWRHPSLALAPALALLAIIFELLVQPAEAWSAPLIGTNGMACFIFILLIGVGPLVILLMALRRGAPGEPAVAGAVAGLLAGGIATTFYAVHCTNDSLLFVATWYTIAILGLAALGAAGAYRLARW
jgi:hypothetical protein